MIRDISADLDWAAVTRTLIEGMPWRVETARLFGREMIVPRMTAWFGDAAYRYSGILHQPVPMPAIVHSLRERAEALSGASFNSVLLNLYRNGRDSVGWHSDHEAGLGALRSRAFRSVARGDFNSGIAEQRRQSRLN